jgi:hypothetical protein
MARKGFGWAVLAAVVFEGDCSCLQESGLEFSEVVALVSCLMVGCLSEGILELSELVALGLRERLVRAMVEGWSMRIDWYVVLVWKLWLMEVVSEESVCCGDVRCVWGGLLLFTSTDARRASEGTKQEMSAPS